MSFQVYKHLARRSAQYLRHWKHPILVPSLMLMECLSSCTSPYEKLLTDLRERRIDEKTSSIGNIANAYGFKVDPFWPERGKGFTRNWHGKIFSLSFVTKSDEPDKIELISLRETHPPFASPERDITKILSTPSGTRRNGVNAWVVDNAIVTSDSSQVYVEFSGIDFLDPLDAVKVNYYPTLPSYHEILQTLKSIGAIPVGINSYSIHSNLLSNAPIQELLTVVLLRDITDGHLTGLDISTDAQEDRIPRLLNEALNALKLPIPILEISSMTGVECVSSVHRSTQDSSVELRVFRQNVVVTADKERTAGVISFNLTIYNRIDFQVLR